MIAINMAGKFPRLPLLRKPQNWTEWWLDTVCLIPVLLVLIYVFEFSTGVMIAVSIAVQVGAAWRISNLSAEAERDTEQDD
jgi:hypothetical protein